METGAGETLSQYSHEFLIIPCAPYSWWLLILSQTHSQNKTSPCLSCHPQLFLLLFLCRSQAHGSCPNLALDATVPPSLLWDNPGAVAHVM